MAGNEPAPPAIEVGRIDGARVAAVTRYGRPTDLLADRADAPSEVGAIVLGRVAGRHGASGGAFVEIGGARPGFLAKGNGKPGEPIVVQVTDDPRPGKGADLTADVALAGRALVHRPFGRGVTASRALPPAVAESGRARLAAVDPPGGWILRRGLALLPETAIAAEVAWLTERAEALRRAAAGAEPPGLLEPAPGVAERLILDTPGAAAVTCEDPAEARRLAAWARRAAPDLVPRIAAGPAPALEEVPALLMPRQPLPSGGAITIEATAALTAVDVDSAADTDPARVDCEAAVAVARLLRLGNIGGTVAIDFLTAARPEGFRAVRRSLARATADDPQPVAIAERAPFGVVLLTRRRRGRPLAAVLGAD